MKRSITLAENGGEKMKWTLLPMLLVGCGVTELEEKEVDTGEETEIQSDGVSPFIIEADAWCYVLEDSERWTFTATVDDPQGMDNVKRFLPNAVSFEDLAGGMVGDSAIACDSGVCTGSANSTSINIGCTTPENFNAIFIVEDEEGNVSEPKTVNCRRGSGVGG